MDQGPLTHTNGCLLYTSDAADEEDSVDIPRPVSTTNGVEDLMVFTGHVLDVKSVV